MAEPMDPEVLAMRRMYAEVRTLPDIRSRLRAARWLVERLETDRDQYNLPLVVDGVVPDKAHIVGIAERAVRRGDPVSVRVGGKMEEDAPPPAAPEPVAVAAPAAERPVARAHKKGQPWPTEA